VEWRSADILQTTTFVDAGRVIAAADEGGIG